MFTNESTGINANRVMVDDMVAKGRRALAELESYTQE